VQCDGSSGSDFVKRDLHPYARREIFLTRPVRILLFSWRLVDLAADTPSVSSGASRCVVPAEWSSFPYCQRARFWWQYGNVSVMSLGKERRVIPTAALLETE
jgi:hypothetical protein